VLKIAEDVGCILAKKTPDL